MKDLAYWDHIASDARENGDWLGDYNAAMMAEARARYTLAERELTLVIEAQGKAVNK
jgi:hypothetical protein